MQPVPDDVLARLNAVMVQKLVPATRRGDYRKWLKYYLDFRVKYPTPDKKSERVHLCSDKMRSKCKTGKDLHHAANVLSLFFTLSPRKKQVALHAVRAMKAIAAAPNRKWITPSPPRQHSYEQGRMAILPAIMPYQ